jgi:hypothetical protein
VAKTKKKIDLTKPVERPRMPLALVFRIFVLGAVAVVASAYAIYRHYYVPRPSMLVPAPPATEVAPEPSSSEWIPAPELAPLPAPSDAHGDR